MNHRNGKNKTWVRIVCLVFAVLFALSLVMTLAVQVVALL